MGTGNKEGSSTTTPVDQADNHPEGTKLGHYVLGKLIFFNSPNFKKLIVLIFEI